ncbi:MAG TPA: ATPase domain-containing protein, partial [Stenomitos sp.]
MPKIRTKYVCNECGAESAQFFGKCPACQSWGTLVEQAVVSGGPGGEVARGGTALGLRSRRTDVEPQPSSSLTLDQIAELSTFRFSSGYGELDRVLGSGIVPGSLVLVGGDPGIGKSTLLLQMINTLSLRHRVLYVCAEESGQQVKLRAQRLGVSQTQRTEARSADR